MGVQRAVEWFQRCEGVLMGRLAMTSGSAAGSGGGDSQS
jgi:hypothetical protein